MRIQTRIGLALAGIGLLLAAALLLGGASSDRSKSTGAAAKPSYEPLLKAGSLKVIDVKRGETVRFRAVSKNGDELHVHGYDLMYELPPGEPVDVRFRADIDGVFMIELHKSEAKVGELRVEP